MEEIKQTKRRLFIFLILTFVIAWILFGMIQLLGITYGQGWSTIFLTLGMFVPACSNLLTRWITKEGFKDMLLRPNWKAHKKGYFLLYFGIPVIIFLSAGLYFLLFPSQFDASLTQLNKLLISNESVKMSPQKLIFVQGLTVLLIGSLINIIPTMGEELGWRGYLLPKLTKLMPAHIALLVTGAIWGIWHMPIIAMGHNYGTSYLGYPYFGILAMTAFCIIIGVIEGYFSIRFQSAVPAAMIHSAINAGAAFANLFVKPGNNPLLGPTIVGIFGNIPFLLIAIYLFYAIKKTEKTTL